MSSRFLKKVEKTFGNKVNTVEKNSENESSDNDFQPNFSNKFDFLQIESGSDDNMSDNEKVFKIDENYNKSTENKRKLKTKKPKKKNTILKCQEMTEDEILDQFNNLAVSSTFQEENNIFCDSLSIKIRNLNENLELQQMFGPSAAGTTGTGVRGRRNDHLSIMKCTFGKRGIDWPQVPVAKLGLAMERLEQRTTEGTWCVVTCTEEYVRGERALKTVMRTGDYQEQMRQWPYHINTLLQMATLLINQEDFTLAADILKRIFYVYEAISPQGLSLLGSSAGGSLSRGNCSLEYRYRLNRGIFVALFQFVLYLCQRSCFTTALEYCKVLLNLNVTNDPLAIVLIIDDIALRGNQYDFLVQFHRQFSSSKSLHYLPNFAFSVALCHFLKASNDKSSSPDFSVADDCLQSALCRFPTFLTTFIDTCHIAVDDRLAQSSFFVKSRDSVPLSVLIGLYVKRSINLWKNGAVLRWVEANVQRLLDRYGTEEAAIVAERQRIVAVYRTVVPLAIKRHLLLSGHGDLINGGSDHGASSVLIFDPYPPANGDGGFDHYVDSDVGLELEDSWVMNLFRSLMPSFR